MLLTHDPWLGPNSIKNWHNFCRNLCKTVKNLTLRWYADKCVSYAKIVLYFTKKGGTLKIVFRRPKAIGPTNNWNNLHSISNKLARKCHIINKTVLKMFLAYETWLGPNSIKNWHTFCGILQKTVKNLTLRLYSDKHVSYAKIVLYITKKGGTLKTVFRRPKAKGPINSPNHFQSINNKLAHIVQHRKKNNFW